VFEEPGKRFERLRFTRLELKFATFEAQREESSCRLVSSCLLGAWCGPGWAAARLIRPAAVRSLVICIVGFKMGRSRSCRMVDAWGWTLALYVFEMCQETPLLV